MRLSVLSLVLLFAGAAYAQDVPDSVSFTGRLVDDNGGPLGGNHTFVFRLYDALAGGSEVWNETHDAVPVDEGLVYLGIGAIAGLDATVFTGRELFLEISVDGVIMQPRLEIRSVPYAMRAGVAASAETLGPYFPDDFVTGVGAGDGLTGGGTTGDVSLDVDFAGSGSATTVARSDHDHAGTYLPAGTSLSCTGTSKVVGLESDGDVVCAADVDTNTTYSAGSGLSLSPTNAFSVSFGGSGSATTAARSDHDHTDVYVPVSTLASYYTSSQVDTLLAGTRNHVIVRGASGANTCVGNGSFALAPYNNTLTITTNGRPIIVHASMRQYKTGSCVQRGHLTLRVNGSLLTDPSGLGMASSYECNAAATLSQPLMLPAGTHTIELMAMGDNGGVCSYGTFDYMMAWELP